MAAAGAASGAAAGTPAPAPPLIPVSPSVPPTKRKRRLADLTSEEVTKIPPCLYFPVPLPGAIRPLACVMV